MNLQNKEILLASLVGSTAAKSIPRLAVVQNEMMKHVVPPIPFLPFKRDENVAEVKSSDSWEGWRADRSIIDRQFAPLSLRRAGTDDEFYTLPYEAMISVSAKNNIVKRSIAKAPHFVGTIKEHWSQDDYVITITGILFGENERGVFSETFPRTDFEKLRDYCISPTGLEVRCDLLQLLGINNIVVEEFSFPFSKGENVQAYDIKALSDFSADFLLEIEE